MDDTRTPAEILKGAREALQRIYDQPDDGTGYDPTDAQFAEDTAEAKALITLIDEWGLAI